LVLLLEEVVEEGLGVSFWKRDTSIIRTVEISMPTEDNRTFYSLVMRSTSKVGSSSRRLSLGGKLPLVGSVPGNKSILSRMECGTTCRMLTA
jgi:hypothetical protein